MLILYNINLHKFKIFLNIIDSNDIIPIIINIEILEGVLDGR